MVFLLEDNLKDFPPATAPASQQEQLASGVPPEPRFDHRCGEESGVQREVNSGPLQPGHQLLEPDDVPQILQTLGAE
jgi:hypothetical protein